MKLKVPRRLTAFFLSMLLGAGMNAGCKKEKISEDFPKDTKEDKTIELVVEEQELSQDDFFIEPEEIEEEEVVYTEDILEKLEVHKIVVANNNAKLREGTSDKSKQIGFLIKNEYLPFMEKLDNNWYKVEYNDGIAYVSGEYVDYIECYDLPYNEDVPFLNENHDIYDYLEPNDIIIATGNVNIRKEPNTNCKKLGKLEKNSTLPFVSKVNDDWYKVKYNGKTAYVSTKYSKESKGYSPIGDITDIVYMTKKSPLFDPYTGDELRTIPKHEIAEVYAQTDDYYLVQSCGSYGFIPKKYSQSLGDKYIIIDISDQNLKLYIDDKVYVDTSVVTGKDKTPTYCGIFDIFKKDTNIYWKEFDVKVKYGLDFNRGIWIHDASWRNKFGGNIYHKKGSHGCVNVKKDVMPKIYEKAELGTPVLVKK